MEHPSLFCQGVVKAVPPRPGCLEACIAACPFALLLAGLISVQLLICLLTYLLGRPPAEPNYLRYEEGGQVAEGEWFAVCQGEPTFSWCSAGFLLCVLVGNAAVLSTIRTRLLEVK